MGGANGSRECAPDDKLRDTHQLQFAKYDGFREGLNPSYRPRATLLRLGRPVGRLAENPAAALAQTGALPVHACRDPFHVGNFRRAEPQNIASAKSALIILSEGTACRRQHRQTKRQAGHKREISDLEPINLHRRPQKSTGIAAVHHAVRRVGINHDGTETRAGTARFANRCAPEFSISEPVGRISEA
jgi:hypothetical protein